MNIRTLIVTIAICIISLGLHTGCSKKDGSAPSYAGTYLGTADSYMDGEFLQANSGAFMQLASGSNSQELMITTASFDIAQDRMTLNGTRVTLAKKAVLGELMYEHGYGTFEGNKLIFEHYLTSRATTNDGSVHESVFKTVYNLTKQ